MHSWIQTHILSELTLHHTRRYSELKPRDVEGNLFMYHLKGLISEGLVEKHEQAYQLTDKGLKLVSTTSLDTHKTREPLQVLSVLVAQHGDEYLMYRWSRQPNLGKVSFPHGMLHAGESIHDAATREAKEKIGYDGPLTLRGVLYVRSAMHHRVMNVFTLDTTPEALPETCFFTPLSTVDPKQYVESFDAVAQFIDSQPHTPFIEDIEG